MPQTAASSSELDLTHSIDILEAQGHRIGLAPSIARRLRQELDLRRQSDEMLRWTNRRFELLLKLASELLMSTEPQAIIGRICENALSCLDADVYFNYLLDESRGGLRLNAYGGISDDAARKIEWLEDGRTLCGCAARDACRILIEDAFDAAGPGAEVVRSSGACAYSCHPLMAHGRILGILSFGSRAKVTFSADDLLLMKAVADHIAVAMLRVQLQNAARRSEGFSRSLIDSSRDCIKMLDLQGNLLFMSAGGQASLGIDDIGPFLNCSWIDLMEGNSRRAALQAVVTAGSGDTATFEAFLPNLRGEPRWWDVMISPIPGVDGKPERLLAISRDITDRRQAEETLRASEQRLRLAIAATHALVYDIDLLHDQINVVEGLHELLGYELGEAISSQWWIEQIHPEDGITLEQFIKLSEKTGTFRHEYRIRHKEGRYVHVLDQGKVVRDSAGQPVRAVGAVTDITAVKQAADAIQAQQRLIDAIFDSILANVAYLDRDFNFVRVNATYAKGSGRSIQQLIGHNHFHLFPNAENQAVFERVRDTGQPYVAHAKPFIYADQPERGVTYWDWWLFPIRGLDGQVEGLVLSLVDVTAVERGRREVERLNEELRQANAAKDHFFAVLSHELRTPLMPVLMAAQVMERDHSLAPEHRETASMIRRNVELEARLIDDLLDLTRISRGKLELCFATVDVHDKVRQVVRMIEHEAVTRQVIVNVEAQATQHHVQGDAVRVQQVLWNLLRNAIKFTPPGGRIAVRTHNPSPDRIVVTVQDSGIGIDIDMLPRIFDAFEQGGRNVTRQFGGLGLGLAISKGLVGLHGGTLAAQSAGRGKGTTFTLELGTSSAPTAVVAQTASASDRATTKNGSRVLLVEDHADSAKTMRLLLMSYGFEVQVAENVASALHSAAAQAFDLIISDIGLPDGSGLDLMRQLKARYGVKGIALSGCGMEEDVRRSLEAGFDVHLTKPVNLQNLEQAIRSIAS